MITLAGLIETVMPPLTRRLVTVTLVRAAVVVSIVLMLSALLVASGKLDMTFCEAVPLVAVNLVAPNLPHLPE